MELSEEIDDTRFDSSDFDQQLELEVNKRDIIKQNDIPIGGCYHTEVLMPGFSMTPGIT